METNIESELREQDRKIMHLNYEIRNYKFMNEVLCKDLDKLKYYSYMQHKTIQEMKKELIKLKNSINLSE
jgi:predicted RNase H-like nuclease (RuvC/YqgF family)